MKLLYKTLSLVALCSLLAACSLSNSPAPAPTVDVQPTLNAAKTEAAATVAAQIESQPSATPLPATATLADTATTIPTNTALPATNTPLPQLPTNTAVPTLKPTVAVVYTSTPANFNCSLTSFEYTGTQPYSAGGDFDARWTVKNTGTDTWAASDVDYKYVSGTKMQAKADSYDLPSDVASGSSITLIVDMKAPTTAGTYSETWALVKGGTTLCTLPVVIKVK